MRLMICWIPLLCGCSTAAVRCDAPLQPINSPAVKQSTDAAEVRANAETMIGIAVASSARTKPVGSTP